MRPSDATGLADAAAKVNDMEGWQFMFSRAQIIGEIPPNTNCPLIFDKSNL